MATFLARTTAIRNKLHVFMSFTFNYIRCSDNVLLFLQYSGMFNSVVMIPISIEKILMYLPYT